MSNIFQVIAGIVKSSVIYSLHFFVRIFPRNKAIWIYSGIAGKFNDNSKYLFLHAVKNFPEIRHIWLTGSDDVIVMLRDKGFECYHKDSLKGILLSLRAKVFIYSSYITDICHLSLSGGAFLFNLWHGIPLKKIEYDIHKGPLRSIYHPVGIKEKLTRFIQFPPLAKKHSAVLTTAHSLRKIFSSAFSLPEDKVLVAQYPRVMPFFWSKEHLQKHIEQIEGEEMLKTIGTFKDFTSVIIYMPTWRDDDPGFINQAISDFALLDKACREQNILFVLKLHANTVFNENISSYKNILLLDSNLDMYPLLPYSTTLLTDYSSIFFDYALLNKRIIFYPFDLENYKSKSREMYFDFEELTRGETIVHSFAELLKIILQADAKANAISSFKKYQNEGFDCDAEINFVKQNIGLS